MKEIENEDYDKVMRELTNAVEASSKSKKQEHIIEALTTLREE